ncbi:MAG: DUF839 domain-containing protein [Bdellovibrionales bacterium]|nr:DUF839 domain-containing protein [Bdellovibrionales bacterium]
MNHLPMATRREFLHFMGRSAAVVSSASALSTLTGCLTTPTSSKVNGPFSPISPTDKDDLVLADGFTYNLLIEYGQKINTSGDAFGYDNDYLAFLPSASGNPNEGYLWSNHESVDPMFVSGFVKGGPRTKQQVEKEQQAVGGSIFRVWRKDSEHPWTVDDGDALNRRLSGQTPIDIVSERIIGGSKTAIGTLANCAGGVTPWGTVLTCEENYHDFYGEYTYDEKGNKTHNKDSRLGWSEFFDHSPEHYGWVVEFNPKTGKAKKLTSMGRYAHECATTQLAKDGRCVVYLADDSMDQCLYKFISEKPDNLEKGELFVANTDLGKWISLDYKKQSLLQEKFKDQTEVLVRCREAAHLLGGTPLDRPEDVEIDPISGHIFVAQTNNKSRSNYHGSILKIVESNNDPLSLTFKAETFLAGGEKNGFSCPDNMAFDQKGNLWMTSDISEKAMGKSPYAAFKNNGLFYIPMSGPHAGNVFQLASAPTDAELTGPTFSSDGETLFLSVQHPGKSSVSLEKLSSHWPHGKSSLPRPAVVTISGPAMKALMTS